MDNAVAIVKAYLHVNGYFTVAEYPILEAAPGGGWRAATDLDVLALRFPKAGRSVDETTNKRMRGNLAFEPDPTLGAPPDQPDMIVGEVKEGRAKFNPAAHNPRVLATALTRFGCCDIEEADAIAQKLVHKGRVETQRGHRIRMVAFGSRVDEPDQLADQVISMGHMIGFLRNYLAEHWDALGQAQLSGDGLGFLALLEKADRGSTE